MIAPGDHAASATAASAAGAPDPNPAADGEQLPFCFRRGTDARAVTCRAKLQTKRCKLNQEINKELRLRAGAENLYKATINRKMKDTIALELSFVNSNLQLLKEKLSELNSSVEIYQHESLDSAMPMIPLGLKETKELNFMEPFADFILEHYSEPPDGYHDAIADIVDIRQAARTPSRDASGLQLLFRYYNLLYFVERRFFPPDRTLGIYFEWYDSLTGVPSCQRTVAFEKACVLFNLGSVYTQIATRQDRGATSGLDAAVENFLRAAGVFRHILETFSNAPSMDLKPQVLQIVVALMLAQARECLFEKLVLQLEGMEFEDDYHLHKDLAGEAAQLQSEYLLVHAAIRSDDIQTFMPECWAGFVPLKAEYYRALAHYHASKSLPASGEMHERREDDKNVDGGGVVGALSAAVAAASVSDNELETGQAKLAHIKESLVCHEEAQRLQRMCRELKNKISLTKLLNESYLRAVCETEILEQNIDTHKPSFDDDLSGIDLTIPACSKFNLNLIGPDFTAYKADDPFKALGPIAIFSARRHWSAPRHVRLQTGSVAATAAAPPTPSQPPQGLAAASASRYYVHSRGGASHDRSASPAQRIVHDSIAYGFHMRGDAPVIVSGVLAGSLADLGGIKEGDFIVELNGIDVKWSTHAHISALIAGCGTSLDLKVITPMDRNYLKVTGNHHLHLLQQNQQHHSQQHQHRNKHLQHQQLIAASSAAQQVGGGNGSVSARSLGSSSGVSSGTSSPTGTAGKAKLRGTKSGSGKGGRLSVSWNPFRRTQSLGKIF